VGVDWKAALTMETGWKSELFRSQHSQQLPAGIATALPCNKLEKASSKVLM